MYLLFLFESGFPLYRNLRRPHMARKIYIYTQTVLLYNLAISRVKKARRESVSLRYRFDSFQVVDGRCFGDGRSSVCPVPFVAVAGR